MRARFETLILVKLTSLAALSSPAACTSTPPAVAATPAKVSAAIDAVAFMSGAWAGEAGGVRFEELWSTPAAGIMLGTGRAMKEGRLLSFELMRVEEREGALVLINMPRAGNAVPFALARIAAGEAVFENLEHDDPVRIIYRRSEDGGLFARTESRDGSGDDFPMKKESALCR